MKFLTPLLILLAASVALGEEPPELTHLREGWELQRKEAQLKANKLYFAELEELKKNFVKAGNLSAAIIVDNAIKGDKTEGKEPTLLTKTRQAREESIENAKRPLDRAYWNKLKVLRNDLQQQGNLNGVIATDNEIKKMLADYKKSNPSQADINPPQADRRVVGKWEFNHKGKTRHFEFKSNLQFTGQLRKTGGEFSGKWRVHADKIILWDEKRKEEIPQHLKILPDDTLMFVGPSGRMTGSRR